MSKTVAVITGSGGLVGVESVKFFSQYFDLILGIDNDSRGYFFGAGGSVSKNIEMLKREVKNYEHYFSEYHTGYRAYSGRVLQSIKYNSNSDDFVFDNEVLCQIFMAGYEISEITCPTKYFPEASCNTPGILDHEFS